MIVKCPGCKTDLEVSEDLLDNNFRCSVCNTKFRLSLTATMDKSDRKHCLNFQDKGIRDEIISITQTKGIGKYLKLFRYAPKSIKFIVVYNSFWFFLNFSVAVATHETSSTCGIFYFILLFPLLKRRNWAWRLLLGLYYLVVVFAIILLACSCYYHSEYAIGRLLDCVFSIIIDTPVFIALKKQTARQWASEDW